MRTIISLLSLAGLCAWPVGAQSIFPSGWTETAVFIQHSAGSGSGFFLQHSNKIFLVTAKHVIFDQTKFPSLVLLATNATCTAWSGETNISHQFTIDLTGSFTARETRGHPSRDALQTLCAVRNECRRLHQALQLLASQTRTRRRRTSREALAVVAAPRQSAASFAIRARDFGWIADHFNLFTATSG